MKYILLQKCEFCSNSGRWGNWSSVRSYGRPKCFWDYICSCTMPKEGSPLCRMFWSW